MFYLLHIIFDIVLYRNKFVKIENGANIILSVFYCHVTVTGCIFSLFQEYKLVTSSMDSIVIVLALLNSTTRTAISRKIPETLQSNFFEG